MVLTTQLVLEDYVKMRGATFHRLASALSDPDASVRAAADGAVTSALASKSRHILTAHFVELVFVLTGGAAHPAYAHLRAEGGGEPGAPAPSGSALLMASPSRRAHVYSTLLSAMSEEQRLTVAAKLANDILGGVVEGAMNLTGRGAGAPPPTHAAGATTAAFASTEGTPFLLGSTELLVAEALSVLVCPAMRGSGGPSKSAQLVEESPEAEEGEGEGAGAAINANVAAVKSRLLAKLAKKQVVENVMPLFLGLRQLVAAARSPLQGALLTFFQAINEDHSEDVKGAWGWWKRGVRTRSPIPRWLTPTPLPHPHRHPRLGPHCGRGARVRLAHVCGGQQGARSQQAAHGGGDCGGGGGGGG